jgi:ornithine cyclodeaminase
MIYISGNDLDSIGPAWALTVKAVREVMDLLPSGDFSQPLKPYLRFRDRTNRIIAMPAYVGGAVETAGIKWIASYPSNIQKKLPRAHSVTILNDASSGAPYCIINSNRISAIRTAAVSGAVLETLIPVVFGARSDLRVGMTGFGPIGKTHFQMLDHLWGNRIAGAAVYDLDPAVVVFPDSGLGAKSRMAGSWQEAYEQADIFITCTVSSQRYIKAAPQKGSIHLNVSLRDYEPEAIAFMDHVVVDDWEEICRENTDVEYMHLHKGMQREDVLSLSEFTLEQIAARICKGETVMLNPMGMAVFDIATAALYHRLALNASHFTHLS